jgi:hypothetical protein
MTYVAFLLDNHHGLQTPHGRPGDAQADLLYEDLQVAQAVFERSIRGPPRAASCAAEA